MFEITKKFSIPIGHRLSKHHGLCRNFHGHNFDIYVTLQKQSLNSNYMVLDFSDFNTLMKEILDPFDHCLLVNQDDGLNQAFKSYFDNSFKVFYFEGEPTAENLAYYFYRQIKFKVKNYDSNINILKVTVFENINSSATYYE